MTLGLAREKEALRMHKGRLLELFAGEDGAAALCYAALLRGASHEVWEGSVGQAQIASIYRRRFRGVQRVGQGSVGFAEAVRRLEEYQGGDIVLGYVDDRPSGGYYFQLFLNVDCTSVVACLGVERPRKSEKNDSRN
ncbi:hypothetical protein GCM10010171_14230 [Actinokineospora fastidiosa]|uniref:Uncharacterized protein n=1 Tax=Actinokineospora fastidiosa TaxID=1816 RepID=A0A918L9E7_9PSEU|nr:hypothetical protein GCM10010171_14230 [Actinokineospora fastidiosa]